MKKFIFTLAFLVSAISTTLYASDLKDAQRSLKSAQKELSALTSKLEKAEQTQVKLQADNEEAITKVEEHKDKPKSLPYKNAVKKVETTTEKMVTNQLLIDQLRGQIDSLNKVVSELDLTVNHYQEQKSEMKAEKKAQKEREREERREQKKNKINAEESATEESILSHNEEKISYEQIEDEIDDSNSPTSVTSTTTSSKSKSSSNDSADDFMSIVTIIVCAIFFVFGIYWQMRRKHYCPKCGKWFTMDSIGDISINQKDDNGKNKRKGVRRRYRCSNCGNQKEIIQWF